MTEPSIEKKPVLKKTKMIETPKSIQAEISRDIEDTLTAFPRA